MNTSARQDFFIFANSKKLQNIYLEAEDLLYSNPESLASFIEDANHENIEVTLLAGDPQWSLAEKHADAIKLAKTACKFVRSLKVSGIDAPKIFRFDIEPYLLDQWEMEFEDTANSYLDLLPRLKTALAGEMELQVAIPSWFKDIHLYRQKSTQSMEDWIMDYVDKSIRLDHQDTSSEIVRPAASAQNPSQEQANPMLALFPSNNGYCVFSMDAWARHMSLVAAKSRWNACSRPARSPKRCAPGSRRLRTRKIIYG